MGELAANHRSGRRSWTMPKSRIGRIGFWLTAAVLLALGLRLLLGHTGAGGFFVVAAAVLFCLLLPFLLIVLLRQMRQRLLWRVRNRLIVTYALMGLAPLVLFGTLAAIAGYIIAGQYSINSALSALDEAADELKGETANVASVLAYPANKQTDGPLQFESGNPREAQASLAKLKDGVWRTVPLVSGRGTAPLSPFAGQPKTAYLKPGFQGVVVFNGKLYLCRYGFLQENKTIVEVLGALELNHATLNSMATSLGRILVYSGFGLGTGSVNSAEKEAQTAEEEADQAQAAREAQRDAQQELREAQRDGQQQLQEAQRDGQAALRDGQRGLAEAQREMRRALQSTDVSPAERRSAEEDLDGAQRKLQQAETDAQTEMQTAVGNLAHAGPPPETVARPTTESLPPPKSRVAAKHPRRSIAPNPSTPSQSAPSAAKTAGEEFTAISGGVLPAAAHLFDPRVYFTAPLPVVTWQDGHTRSAMLVVISRPSSLYTRLFSTSVDMGSLLRNLLVAMAILFGVLEVIALWMATRLSRTITRSVAELYRGTTEIDKGNLSYRVHPDRQDQLGALANSFNAMAGSIEDLLVQQREKERLISELAIAQEVQSNLFPRSPATTPGLQLHAACLPARTVSGDYFDFIFEHGHETCIALGDISGKGISAALLMASLHSAVRAFRLGDNAATPSPARLLELLNQHLYSSTQSNKYATLFLAFYNHQKRRFIYSNGGHLTPFILSRAGTVRRLDVGGAVVGLLDGMSYEEATVELQPGDLLVAYTDGLTEPENDANEFGEDRLLEHLLLNRDQALPLVVDGTFQMLKQWIGDHEQPDDMTILLARQL